MTDRYYKITDEGVHDRIFDFWKENAANQMVVEDWIDEFIEGAKPFFYRSGILGRTLLGIYSRKRLEGFTVPGRTGHCWPKRGTDCYASFEQLKKDCSSDSKDILPCIVFDNFNLPGFFLNVERRIFVIVSGKELDLSRFGKEITNIEYAELEKEEPA